MMDSLRVNIHAEERARLARIKDGPKLPLSWLMRERMSQVKEPPSNDSPQDTQWLPLEQRIRNSRTSTFTRSSTVYRSEYATVKPASIQQFPSGWSSLADCTASLAIQDSTGTSAAARVFGITELLEEILLQLSFRDLLLSQRASRGWEAVITHSSKLQQRLFFKPRPASYAWLHDGRHVRPYSSGDQSLPHGGFVRKVPLEYQLSDSEASSGKCWIRPSSHLHPLYKFPGSLAASGKKDASACSILRHNMKKGNYLPSGKHPEASWRKMFWCQPPTNHFGMEYFATRELLFGSDEEETSDDSDDPESSLYDEPNEHNYRIIRVIRDKVLNVSSYPDWYDRSDEEDPKRISTRKVVGEGYLTVGEVMETLEGWSSETGFTLEKCFAYVYAFDRIFPSAKQVDVGIVWDEEDDKYYKPLAEKDKILAEGGKALAMIPVPWYERSFAESDHGVEGSNGAT